MTQLHEQWYVAVGAPIVFGPTPDLPDRVETASVAVAGTFTTDGGEVVLRHRATVDAEGHSSFNSVTVAKLCFARQVRPTVPQATTPSTTQVPVTTLPVVSTIPATVPPSTWTPDPPAYAVVTTTTAAPTTTAPAVVVATSSTVLERPAPVAAVLPMVEATPAVPVVATPTFAG